MSTSDGGTLQAYVSGTRRALMLQLLIAVALVAITGFAAYNLWNITRQTANAHALLASARQDFATAKRDEHNFQAARPDFRAGVEALDAAARETDAEKRSALLQTALSSLTSAAQKAQDTDADICRYLSRAQYLNGQAQSALISLQAAMRLTARGDAAAPPVSSQCGPEAPIPSATSASSAGGELAREDAAPAPPAEQPISADTLRARQVQQRFDSGWLAANYCASGNVAGARQIITNPDFIGFARDPSFAQAVPLAAACGQALPTEVAALQPGAAATVQVSQDETSAYYIHTIFIQYVRAEDLPKVQRVREALIAAHYEVPTPQLIAGASASVIRYYFDAQRTQADQVLDLVKAQMAALDWGADLRAMHVSSLQGRFPNLRHDRAELWLPAGVGGDQPAAPTRAPVDPRRAVEQRRHN